MSLELSVKFEQNLLHDEMNLFNNFGVLGITILPNFKELDNNSNIMFVEL